MRDAQGLVRVFSLRVVIAFVVALFVASHAVGQESAPAKTTPPADATKKANTRPSNLPSAPAEPFDGVAAEKMIGQCVRLETEAGVIEMEMLPESAPETVRNFLNLVATGAFNTTTFSRVVKDFVIQGGNLGTSQNLTAALAQRSRRSIPDEPNAIKHERGIVSMARPDSPNSATTNFFILVGNGAHLDGKFAAFGRVTKGIEVADAINQAAVDGEKPEKPVRISRATVYACPH
jgi:peptidyl-prolyl cis-trans isomerase B (cyclophilin B)